MSSDNTQQIERSSRGLVRAMFDEMDDLIAGRSTPQQARAKASIANTICSVSRLEMDYARFVAEPRNDVGDDNGLPALSMK